MSVESVEKVVLRIFSDFEYRDLFLSNRSKALEGYELSQSEFKAFSALSSEYLKAKYLPDLGESASAEMAQLAHIFHDFFLDQEAESDPATFVIEDVKRLARCFQSSPAAVLCPACNGMGVKTGKPRKNFLGTFSSISTCKNCSGKGCVSR